MESLDKQMGSSSGQLNAEIKGYIVTISKWGKFLSIIGFIGIGFMLLGAISIAAVSSSMNLPQTGFIPMSSLAIVYVVMAVLYFFPILYLWKASTNLKGGVDTGNEFALTEGFKNLKSHYKFMGIMVIVIISLYILGIMFAIMTAAF